MSNEEVDLTFKHDLKRKQDQLSSFGARDWNAAIDAMNNYQRRIERLETLVANLERVVDLQSALIKELTSK